MRRRFMIVLLAALAALATFATAQVQNEDGTDSLVSASGRTVFSVPATTPGPLFEDTPSTVFHWAADTWNPIRFSNDMSSATAWAAGGGTVAGGQQDPLGGMTATAIVENALSTWHGIAQTNVNVGAVATRTVSVYVKPGARTWAYVQAGINGSCYFNLAADGAVGTCFEGAIGGIARAANGYYRIYLTGQLADALYALFFDAALGDNQSVYQGTAGVTAATFFGPQIDLGSVPQPYRSAGDVLVMNGTVPLVTTSPLFAKGSGAGRRMVGPFTDANYFSRASTALFASMTVCVAFKPETLATQQVLISDESPSPSTYGFHLQMLAGNTVSFTLAGAAGAATSVNTVTQNALNVACGGVSGATEYVKLNGSATASGSTTGAIDGVNRNLFIGRNVDAGNPHLGSIYEVWVTSTAWSEASVAQIEANALANGGKGPLFPDDAGTVLHLTGDAYAGALWKAPQATLTTYGAVPYSDAWVPPIAGAEQRQSYGPFSAANFFALGSGSDVLDFAGDFSGCLVLESTPSSASRFPFSDGGNTTTNVGYSIVRASASHTYYLYFGSTPVVGAASVGSGGYDVLCFGRAGSTVYFKQNLGSIASGAVAGGWTPDTTESARVGIGPSGMSSYFYDAPIYEAWFSTDPASDALFTKLQQRAFQHLSAQGRAITTTRTSGATYEAPSAPQPTIRAVPGSVTVSPPDGSEIWRTSTNLVLNSSAFDQATWTKSGTVGQEAQVTAIDSAIAPDGTQTADTIYLSTVTTAQRSQLYAGVSGYGVLPIVPHTTSVWVKGVSDSATVFIRPWIAALGRTLSSGSCTYNATTWTRCSHTWTPDAGNSGTVIEIGQVFALHGAQNEKKFYAWGFQTEAQPYVTPYTPTGGTTAVRNGSAISIANPIPASSTSWCLRFTARPGTGHTWAEGQSYTFLSSGADGSANSFSVTQDPAGSLIFTVYDSATAAKWISTPGFTDSTRAHDVAVCLRQGVPYIYVDGYRSTGLAGGLGTGIIAAPQSTVYLGSSNGTTNFLDGVVRDVQLCDRPTGACTQNATPTANNATTYYPWAQSGSFITDANTIANVTFSGSAIVDPYNVTTPWTMVGSVGQNLASPFYTTGFSGAQVKGAGPFAAAVYYKLVGGGALGFPGGVGSMCWAYNKSAGYGTAAAVALGAFGVYNTAGWQLTDDGTFFINGAGTNRGVVSDTPTLFGLNVICAGLNNNVPYIKVNGGAYAAGSALASPYVPPTGDATLGWYAVNKFLNGALYAFWASTTAPSDALFTRQIQNFLGARGVTNNEVLTTTRTTAAYGLGPDAGLYVWPPGVPRVACDGASSKCGLQVEPARTNLLTYSQTFDPLGWTPLNMTTTAVAGGGPGGVDAERVTVSAAAAAKISQAYATSGAQTFTFSVWAKAGTQGAYASIQILKDASGGTCVIVPLTSTWARYTVTDTQTYTASATALVASGYACGAVAATAGDNFYIAAPQLELGSYASSYIPTTSTSATRNADVITTPNYISVTSGHCIDGVFTPESAHSWVTPTGQTAAYLWTAGTGVNAYTYKLYGDTQFYGEVRDGDNLAKQLTLALPSTFTAGSSHRVSFNYSPLGLNAYTIMPDSGLAYGTLSGAGTGILNVQPQPIYLGANSSTGSEWGGFIRHLRLCNAACQVCR